VEAVERFAVTEAQVDELGLPTRPQKEPTHRRDGDLGWAVELDALPLGASARR
jgi:hypothetical protein